MKNLFCMFLILSSSAWLGGCSTVHRQTVGYVPAVQAPSGGGPAERLDVAVQTFGSGLGSSSTSTGENVFPEIREAELRFIPFELKRTLDGTGNWGNVWVIPTETYAADVLVNGTIVTSDWEQLAVALNVVDASGRVWLNKTYRAKAGDIPIGGDPYQGLYNTIANDMLEVRNRIGARDLRRLREIAQLRFAQSLASDPFGAYLQNNADGRLELKRLPARDDPMMMRVLKIREREHKLLDTLNLHYANFHQDMEMPYRSWQRAAWQEGSHYRELKRQGMWRKMLGAAAVLGAIAADASGAGSNTAALRGFAVVGGMLAFQSGMQKDAEAEIHADAIQELGVSLSSEVAPMTVQVEGQTRELTGSAEEQYREWRRMLRQIYISEVGLASANVPTVPAPAPAPVTGY